ncbi:MAG: hypothetical protein ACUVRY_05810 [Thermoanaerobaculaceae bacterium]
MLLCLAGAIEASGDLLMKACTEEATNALLEDRHLLRQYQKTRKLPAHGKTVLMRFLDTFFGNHRIEDTIKAL